MKIFKTLPEGKKVEREVSAQEYIQDGWREQGWVAPASLQKQAEDYMSDQIMDAISDQPIDQLKGYAKHYTIVKKLPNGKWAKKFGVGGYDFEFGGWMNNGWIIPSWAHRGDDPKAPKDTARARAYFTRQIRETQHAWKPKRTQEQANQFLKGTWLEPGPDYMAYSTQLTSPDKEINPAYKKWQTRALKWARHNRRNLWKDLTSGTSWQKRNARYQIVHQFKQRRSAPNVLIQRRPKRYPGFIDIPYHHFRRSRWLPGTGHY